MTPQAATHAEENQIVFVAIVGIGYSRQCIDVLVV